MTMKPYRQREKDLVTERLIAWVKLNYPSRGKFTKLQEDSGVLANRWKSLYYRKQFATLEMLAFVRKVNPNDHDFICSGVGSPNLEVGGLKIPRPPHEESRSIESRLLWVVKQWAYVHGSSAFRFLEEESDSHISADDWAHIIMGKKKITVEILELVFNKLPQFKHWVLYGLSERGYSSA